MCFLLLHICVLSLNGINNITPKVYETIADYYKLFLFNQQRAITQTIFAEYLKLEHQTFSLLPDLGRRGTTQVVDEGWQNLYCNI